MRNVIHLAARKIGAFVAGKRTAFVGQIFYDAEHRTAGVGDGTLNPPIFLTNKGGQTIQNMTLDFAQNIISNGDDLGALKVMSVLQSPGAKYLQCDGSAINRTDFPDLFALIGVTYGSGDGSTTFNLPPANVLGVFSHAIVYIRSKK